MYRVFLLTTVFVSVFVGVFMASVPSVMAQSTEGELRDVKAFKIYVTGFNEASLACGLEPEAMKDAFLQPLRDAGPVMAEEANGYWIAIRATSVVRQEATCVTFVDASVLQSTRYFNQSTDSERVGKVLHWADAGLIVSDEAGHGDVVKNAYLDLGRRLAEVWRRDQ
jgi:hypothetical protein